MNKINLVLLVVISTLIYILIVKLKVYEDFSNATTASPTPNTLTPMPSNHPNYPIPTKFTSVSGQPFYNLYNPTIKKY